MKIWDVTPCRLMKIYSRFRGTCCLPSSGQKDEYDVYHTTSELYLQMHHLENNEGIVEEQSLAADDGQVGEQLADRPHSVDAVHQQVVRDLPQLWKRQVSEAALRGVVDQHDLHEALHDPAPLQTLECLHLVPNVDTLAHCATNTQPLQVTLD